MGKTLIVLTVILLSAGGAASASDAHEKLVSTLMVISEYAENICNKLPLEGGSRLIELNADVTAEVSGLFKKFADLGMTGGGQFKDAEYTGLIQEELANTFVSNANCKERVSGRLEAKILPDISQTEAEQSSDVKTVTVYPELEVFQKPKQSASLAEFNRQKRLLNECGNGCIDVNVQPTGDADINRGFPTGSRMVYDLSECDVGLEVELVGIKNESKILGRVKESYLRAAFSIEPRTISKIDISGLINAQSGGISCLR